MQAYKKQIVTRPQDVLILLKIISCINHNKTWNIVSLTRDLFISQSEISESLSRSVYSNLISYDKKEVQGNALFEFVVHGIKYAFPTRPGYLGIGIGTAHSAPPLSNSFRTEENYIWEFAAGNMRGQVIEPLYKTVPKAVLLDNTLYELLALTDALRVGKAREKNIATDILQSKILNY